MAKTLWVTSSQQGRARWAAHRGGIVALSEADAVVGDRVNVWGPHFGVAECPEVGIASIIGDNEDDVGP